MKGLIEGNLNYLKKTKIKQNRLDACNGCVHNIDAPIIFLKKKDENKIIDGKICDKCYCPLPTLLRQDKKICEFWKEEQ